MSVSVLSVVITAIKSTCYITELSTEKGSMLEYFSVTKEYGKTLLGLDVHVGYIVQTVCSQLYMPMFCSL